MDKGAGAQAVLSVGGSQAAAGDVRSAPAAVMSARPRLASASPRLTCGLRCRKAFRDHAFTFCK